MQVLHQIKFGNLCIAGHNYADKRFFGRLKELAINDKITIYDLSGNSLDYFIYERKEINPDDLSCMSQETNGQKIITLITCNNMSDKRLLIKAKTL
ncbi:MAG: sortase [Clostridia bacterium]|nr:sortase [Clostridia bacterium]